MINGGAGRLGSHVAMVNMRLQIPLVLRTERAMGTVKRGRHATLVKQVPLEYVSIFVTLATA